jgi:hypothetical protein
LGFSAEALMLGSPALLFGSSTFFSGWKEPV